MEYEDGDDILLIEKEELEAFMSFPQEQNQVQDATQQARRRGELMEDGDDTGGEPVTATTGKDPIGYAPESAPVNFQTSVQVIGFLILVGLTFLIVIQTKILKELRKSKKR